MKPIRQIEAAEHLVAGGPYTVRSAKALLAVAKPEMLEEPPSAKLQATSEAARAMLEDQNEFFLRGLRSVEESYGTDALTLTVSRGYGYRKIRVLLNREGWDVGKHLVYRLYMEEGLCLQRMRPAGKRKADRPRAGKFKATAPDRALKHGLRGGSVAGRDEVPFVDDRR